MCLENPGGSRSGAESQYADLGELLMLPLPAYPESSEPGLLNGNRGLVDLKNRDDTKQKHVLIPGFDKI